MLAFAVVTLDSHIVVHGQGGSFREDGRAGVTPPIGSVPVLVGVEGQVEGDLLRMCFGFLETDDIWIVRCQAGV